MYKTCIHQCFCWYFYSVHILTLTKHLSSKLYKVSKHFTHVYNRFMFNNGKQHHDTSQYPNDMTTQMLNNMAEITKFRSRDHQM